MSSEEQRETYIKRKLKRLDYLAQLLYQRGFEQMGDEVASIQKIDEIEAFYTAIQKWLF